MKIFRVLVVDDDPDILDQARNAFPTSDPIKVHTADSLDVALEVIRQNFIHVAFVDLQLKQKAKNIEGKTFLRDLVDIRPSCRRFLLTQYPDEYRQDFFDLLHPINPIIHGALDKHDYHDHFTDVIRPIAGKWLSRAIDVENVSELFSLLEKKSVSSKEAHLTVDEIDYLISVLLGQGIDVEGKTGEDIDRILLHPLEGGRSRSIVALGRPRNAAGQEGIYCVIKVGLRKDTDEEYSRYRRYVQFLVSLNRRVELLGYVPGDIVGAICYSFAGKSPTDIFSMASLFDQEDLRVIEHLNNLVDPNSKEWYAKDRVDKDLARYFNHTYGLDAHKVLESVIEFAEKVAPQFGGVKMGDQVRFDGDKLTIPKKVIGAGKMRATYQACIVHGDLNAENIILSDDNRIIYIDFRYTGWGPKSLEAGRLEAEPPAPNRRQVHWTTTTAPF